MPGVEYTDLRGRRIIAVWEGHPIGHIVFRNVLTGRKIGPSYIWGEQQFEAFKATMLNQPDADAKEVL